MPRMPAQDQALQSDYEALCRIQQTLHPRARQATDFVEATLLSSLQICVSELDVSTENHIDMEPRYIMPVSQAAVDHDFLAEYGLKPDSLMLPWPDLERPENHDREKAFSDAVSYSCKLELAIDSPTFDSDLKPSRRESVFYRTPWKSEEYFDGPLPSRYEDMCFDHRPLDTKWWYCGPHYIARSNRRGDSIAEPAQPKPHTQLIVLQAAPLTGSPLTGEVLTIVTLMKRQMRNPDLWRHRLFPVIAYTFNGPSVRISQAVFDNNQLHIRQSPAFNIRCAKRDFSNLRFLMRWFLGEPCGDTLWPSSENEEPMEQEPAFDTLSPPGNLSPKITLSA